MEKFDVTFLFLFDIHLYKLQPVPTLNKILPIHMRLSQLYTSALFLYPPSPENIRKPEVFWFFQGI